MKTIAVVEDNSDNTLLLRVILEDNYNVVEYDSGISALEGMRQSAPDLILLDISLPGMDGMEVLNRMKSDDVLKSLPVIALTAHAAPSDREKFLVAGFTDYVTKPIVDVELLLSAITRQIG